MSPAPPPLPLDLNVDLGERDAAAPSRADLALLELATSVNLSCGLHAGTPPLLRALLRAAAARGLRVGAHPSFDDRAGFGRREQPVTPAELESLIYVQVEALASLAAGTGATLRHVKPHGALYHLAARDTAAAAAVAAAAHAHGRLALIGPPRSALAAAAAAAGLVFFREGFLDRAYHADGSLVPRNQPGAVLTQPAIVAARAQAFARGEAIRALDGATVSLRVDTACVHGDSPHAVELLRAAHRALVTR
jgi:UPF0271 protein